MMGQPPRPNRGLAARGPPPRDQYFVLAIRSMTPLFLGGEPAVTTTGRYAGNAILRPTEWGLAFMRVRRVAAAGDTGQEKCDDLQQVCCRTIWFCPLRAWVDGLSPAPVPAGALIARTSGTCANQGRVRMQESTPDGRHMVRLDGWHPVTLTVLLPDPQPGHPDQFDHQRPVGDIH